MAVSDVMRAALDDYLASRAGGGEKPSVKARMAIAESARLRKLARVRQRAPVLPGAPVSPAALWRPPPGLSEPRSKHSSTRVEFPISRDRDGNPVEPPVNAVAWRVLVQRSRSGPRSELRLEGWPLIFDLRIKHHEFAYAVGRRSGVYYFEPINEQRRVLRFTEIRVPLGDAVEWED